MRKASLLLFLVVCLALSLVQEVKAQKHSISNIRLDPPSPATLIFNEKVNVTFDYTTNEPVGVRIFVRPFTRGSLTSNYAASGSPLYPTGRGKGEAYFTIRSGEVTVDQLRFQITSRDQSRVLREFFIPVSYRFRKEDCISFDYQKAEIKKIGGSWKIVVGRMWLKDFGNSEREARQALRIIKHYRMNQQCFVGRPDPSMEYYLVDGKAPKGYFVGEDCVSFNPATIEVRKIGGRWKIVDGTHWILDFGGKEGEARTAFSIVKKYGFNRICFVGRPDPSMTYFRR